MSKFLVLFIVCCSQYVLAQPIRYVEKMKSDDALNTLLKLNGVQYLDSAITFDFKQEDYDNNSVLNKEEKYDYRQLHPLYVEAFKAVVDKNRVLEYKISILETTLMNLEIELMNNVNQINYKITNIENEISP